MGELFGAGSGESRLLLCCGCAPTGSVRVARVAAGLQPTAIGEVTILVRDPLSGSTPS